MAGQETSFRNLSSGKFGELKKEQHQGLQNLTKPHLDSFNYMLREGLACAVKQIPPVEIALPGDKKISVFVEDASIAAPAIDKKNIHATHTKVFPTECREGRKTYKGALTLRVTWMQDGVVLSTEDHMVGEIPIMVKSVACNIHKMSPRQLVDRGEEAEEMGGYFIVRGYEKVIRMLIMPRRNFPTVESRPSWKERGPLYTEYGVMIRCVKKDQTAANMVLHYLNNGTVNLCFVYKKQQFFVPVIIILKALMDTPDYHIFTELTRGREKNSHYEGCIKNMLRQVQEENLLKRNDILRFISKSFRIVTDLPSWFSDLQVGKFLIKHCVCIHLNSNVDKFNLLIMMTRKLFTYANGGCARESSDNTMFQEVLLPGHLYQMILKEKIETWLLSIKTFLDIMKRKESFKMDHNIMKRASQKNMDIGSSMEHFLSTGNLVSRTGLGLMQYSGMVIQADKLNFLRFVSHFRCIHRGAFFASMRTTGVRKLLPEAWGFLCPVHTPDGSPCGLMNHMSAACQVVVKSYDSSPLPALLCGLGMSPYDLEPPLPETQCYEVMLDGRMIGWIPDNKARSITEQLRALKLDGAEGVPTMMEICLVMKRDVASQYPGLFLFTDDARMVRPVKNLSTHTVEMIGTFEQPYMHICITPEEGKDGVTTHEELSETTMLSFVASMTPYSDFNQSPRNMYQCQMGKQTMGFPLHAWGKRSDNKLYRLQTPQSPLVRPANHDLYDMDNYPVGTNAVVAVISYTGYDMEDAFILHKSSFERGFGHGTVYKSELIDLADLNKGRRKSTLVFGCTLPHLLEQLDVDGLPRIGALLKEGDTYYSYVDMQTGVCTKMQYKGSEAAYVDNIKVIGDDRGDQPMTRVCFVLRVPRNPIIGDKFSSRHGQKGVCSMLYPTEDMPFSETGMIPDILFNPHGFPSRMTIGMLIESMGAKAAAMHGLCLDATPFQFSEDDSAIDYMGKLLNAAGYNYHGNERFYSGMDGREFEADIFVGCVYYQRLRHMVSDKFQVRSTGAVDPVTRQPLKGRKKGGGVRFGEMERDSMLAHGSSFLLHDRLLNCSDECKTQVCTKCGSLLSPIKDCKIMTEMAAKSYEQQRDWRCRTCKRRDTIELVRLPYVFRYLVAELAAMNIKTVLSIKEN